MAQQQDAKKLQQQEEQLVEWHVLTTLPDMNTSVHTYFYDDYILYGNKHGGMTRFNIITKQAQQFSQWNSTGSGFVVYPYLYLLNGDLVEIIHIESGKKQNGKIQATTLFLYNGSVYGLHGKQMVRIVVAASGMTMTAELICESSQFESLAAPQLVKRGQVGHCVWMHHKNYSTSFMYQLNMATFQVTEHAYKSPTASGVTCPGLYMAYDSKLYSVTTNTYSLIVFDTITCKMGMIKTKNFTRFNSWYHMPCLLENKLVELLQMSTGLQFDIIELAPKKKTDWNTRMHSIMQKQVLTDCAFEF